MRAEVTELEGTAYHEAGHAVLKCAYGVALRHATIIRDDESEVLGHVAYTISPSFHPDYDTSSRTRSRAEALIMSSMAGRIAEQRSTGIENLEGAEHDIHWEVGFASRMTGSSEEAELYLAWLEHRTRRGVEHRWWAIEAVAAELLKRRKLSAKQVRRVI